MIVVIALGDAEDSERGRKLCQCTMQRLSAMLEDWNFVGALPVRVEAAMYWLQQYGEGTHRQSLCLEDAEHSVNDDEVARILPPWCHKLLQDPMPRQPNDFIDSGIPQLC